MKPVDQTLTGAPGGPLEELGNCYPACIASLLELPLSEVPHWYQLVGAGNTEAAHVMRDAWLAERGLAILRLDLKSLASCNEFVWSSLVGVMGIFSGLTNRHEGVVHAVVGTITKDAAGLDWKLLHDPHPMRSGFRGLAQDVEVFIQIDPAKGLGFYGRHLARAHNALRQDTAYIQDLVKRLRDAGLPIRDPAQLEMWKKRQAPEPNDIVPR